MGGVAIEDAPAGARAARDGARDTRGALRHQRFAALHVAGNNSVAFGARNGADDLKRKTMAARRVHELSQEKGRAAGLDARLSTAISTRCPPQAGQMSSDRPKSRA